jgi:ATP-dependent DNA helicase RecG
LTDALTLLREEWRDDFRGAYASRAVRAIQHAQSLTSDQDLALALARVEAQIDTYIGTPVDQRQPRLAPIGNEIKAIQKRVSSRKPVARTPQAAQPPARKPRPAARQLDPESPVEVLPRVGPVVAKKLAKLGIRTISDVLRDVPRRHIDYSQIMSIRDASSFGRRGDVTIRARIEEITPYTGPPARVSVRLSDQTGALRVTWFNRYLVNQLKIGDEIAVSGTIEAAYNVPSMTNPEWERYGETLLSTGRMTPVYNLTQGVAQKTMRSLSRAALDSTRTNVADPLPAGIRERFGLMPLAAAYEEAHYPQSELNRQQAIKRLAFDELFLLQLGMVRVKQSRATRNAPTFRIDGKLLQSFRRSLPFQLTTAQNRALEEVLVDLASGSPMMRLLQGDVGSGKTVVAAIAALVATNNGMQAALMSPTEILAEQHAATFTRLYESMPTETRPRVGLLTGSVPAKRRRELLAALEDGELDILIGTQALIQKGVEFGSLGLLVVDEQHRFGVRQRAHLLAERGGLVPHVLAMTATPIPRTLNMVLNGDTEVSVIDQLPSGRVPIETRRYTPDERAAAYDLVRTEVEAGRQVFVICPLVEESESSDAKAATAEAERLQTQVFPELRVQVLHGRMPAKEKDRIMTAFRNQEFDILVSTSVIEVGIDIPNATIMMIEGANHFGLAQLHQFRGRVGRGAHRSYCLLIADDSSNDAEQRLRMMVASNDGFALAQKDLELRGPGDFVGTRQSGLPEMPIMAGSFDTRILDAARRAAETLLKANPELASEELALLRQRLAAFWADAAPDMPMST